MHANMKYYVVTMGGIFISLGIGMLVGFNLNYDHELSKQQTEIINELDAKFEKLKNTNDSLEESLSDLNLAYDEVINFIGENKDKLVSEELLNKSIGIISINNKSNVNYVEDIITKSNGMISYNINLTDKINLDTLVELSNKIEVEIKSTEEFITYLLELLSTEESVEKLQVLEELELINVLHLDTNYTNFTSVVVDIDNRDEEYKEEFNNINKMLINKLKSKEKYIVGVQTTEAKDSYIDLYSENEVATIDNINQDCGQLALVLLLKNESTIDNFGISENAKSIIPYNNK